MGGWGGGAGGGRRELIPSCLFLINILLLIITLKAAHRTEQKSILNFLLHAPLFND